MSYKAFLPYNNFLSSVLDMYNTEEAVSWPNWDSEVKMVAKDLSSGPSLTKFKVEEDID